jgi:hypothetical protein
MYTQHPPPPISHLFRRLAPRLALAAAIIVSALSLGIGGYHACEGLSFLDSFLNASMILSGMGPVAVPVTVGGKVFASLYALFSGIVFLTVAAIVLGPVMTRILHRFHFEMGQAERGSSGKSAG